MNVMTDNLICPNIIMCTDCDCTYHFYVILKSRWQQFSFLKIYLQCILLICIHVFYSFTLPPATLTPTPHPQKKMLDFDVYVQKGAYEMQKPFSRAQNDLCMN